MEIYEKYHDPELILSVAVIDSEVERCKQIIPNLDGELLEAMNGRIEILEFAKESIENDIQNDFLDIAGYIAQIKQYYKDENSNFQKA